MKIEVAKSAGFCPGVRRAVDLAYEALARNEGESLWLYGAVVHNEHVIADLAERGARIAHDTDDIPSGMNVLVRAHGVSPKVERQLTEKNCTLLDGTCPFVKKIQKIVAAAARAGKGIIITGTQNHPEVVGLIGHAVPSEPILIETAEEAEERAFEDKEWILVSQTTFSYVRWKTISDILKAKIANLEIFDTICSTTVQRQLDAETLAASSDVMLVLGSKTSSNTNKLVEVCQGKCGSVYLIHKPDQVAKIIAPYAIGSKRIGVITGASTPDGMIREVIYSMTTIEGMTKPEEQADVILEEQVDSVPEPEEQVDVIPEPEEQVDSVPEPEEQVEVNSEDHVDSVPEPKEQADFNFEDYIDSIPELQPKSIVRGRIVRYDEEFVYVDVKDKSEGKVPIRELQKSPDFDLDEAVREHKEVDVYIRSIRSSDAGKEIMLSTGYVETMKHKELIQQAYEERQPLSVHVVNVVRDGVIATYKSIDIYIHRTQLELSIVDDLEPYRDQTFDVLITQYDPNRRRMRVSGSRRALLQHERKASEREIWDTIEVGNKYVGIVRNLTNFGAFVDIGGVDGLVHISELSWQRIRHPSEVLSVGDKINVHVKDFDRSRKRISLGYRSSEDDPYRDIEARFPVGAIVRGVVVRMFPFGAFINIAPQVDALCHISQISNYHLDKPGDVLVEGMEVDARVVEVSDESRRISVSIREVEPINPSPDSEIVLQQQEQQSRQPQTARRRGGKRRGGQDDLPTSYVDSQTTSSISDMADITTGTKDSSKQLDSMAALRDELHASEQQEEQKQESEQVTEEVVAEEEMPEPIEAAEAVEDAVSALAEPVPAAIVEVAEEAVEEPVEEAATEPEGVMETVTAMVEEFVEEVTEKMEEVVEAVAETMEEITEEPVSTEDTE